MRQKQYIKVIPMNDEYEIKMSPLSRSISNEGIDVQIDIYADGDGGWILEVIDGDDNSIVWDDPFKTDEEALNEAIKTIEKEGISSLANNCENEFH